MTELTSFHKPRAIGVRSPAWAQSVDAPAAWATEHQWLLETAFAEFDRTGEWPSIERVQRVLAGDRDRATAVEQLMIDIPPELGARHTRTIVLTPRALVHVPAAAELLDLLTRTMVDAARIYEGGEQERPRLLGSEIKRKLDLAEPTYRKLLTILQGEGWFLGDGGEDGDDWYRTIRVEVLHARDARNINDYLDALARYRFGPPTTMTEPISDPRIGPAKRLRRWLNQRDLTARDQIVVGVLVGVIVAVVVLAISF